MFFLQSMGEAKSTFGDRDVRSTADNLVMVSEIYSTVVNACFLNLSNRGSMTAIFSLSDCNFTSVACEDSRVFSVELYMLVYTRNFCCDFRCKFLLLMDVNEWMRVTWGYICYAFTTHLYSFTCTKRRKSYLKLVKSQQKLENDGNGPL
jgi:hypothetical protein